MDKKQWSVFTNLKISGHQILFDDLTLLEALLKQFAWRKRNKIYQTEYNCPIFVKHLPTQQEFIPSVSCFSLDKIKFIDYYNSNYNKIKDKLEHYCQGEEIIATCPSVLTDKIWDVAVQYNKHYGFKQKSLTIKEAVICVYENNYVHHIDTFVVNSKTGELFKVEKRYANNYQHTPRYFKFIDQQINLILSNYNKINK